MLVDVEEVNYIFMVCLYLKLKKHFLAIFGYSFWKCVAKLATVSKILAGLLAKSERAEKWS